MTIENISLSNSTKVLDHARIKLGASDCPSGTGNICICCKHQSFRDVLNLSQ